MRQTDLIAAKPRVAAAEKVADARLDGLYHRRRAAERAIRCAAGADVAPLPIGTAHHAPLQPAFLHTINIYEGGTELLHYCKGLKLIPCCQETNMPGLNHKIE